VQVLRAEDDHAISMKDAGDCRARPVDDCFRQNRRSSAPVTLRRRDSSRDLDGKENHVVKVTVMYPYTEDARFDHAY
jgi:hypothetical protein